MYLCRPAPKKPPNLGESRRVSNTGESIRCSFPANPGGPTINVRGPTDCSVELLGLSELQPESREMPFSRTQRLGSPGLFSTLHVQLSEDPIPVSSGQASGPFPL